MRICHVIESAGTGAGQVVIDLSHYCASQGDEVTVIAGARRAEAHFVDTLSAMPGVKLVFSSMRREIGLHDARDAWLLYKELRRHGPFDVIHGHSSKGGALARLAGIFFPKAVKAYTAHGFITMAPSSSRAYGWIERFLSCFCDAVVAVSEGEGRHALSLGIPAHKVKVIPNGTTVGPQTPREEARRELEIAQEDVALGFVGRMESQKNPLLLIEAFAVAVREHPELKLNMIGEGSLMSEVRAAVARKGLQDNARLLGYRHVRRLMPAFDALVCSSDYETLPISFLEALSAGVPVITRYVGGVEEAIVEGQTGFLAQGPEAEHLAQAIKAFAATTPEQRRAMREHTQNHAKNFTLERTGKATRDLYQSLLA